MCSNEMPPAKRFRPLFCAILFVGFVFVAYPLFSQNEISRESDLVFAVHEGMELKMNLAYPNDRSGSRPVLIYIPGNGWGHLSGPGFDRHQYDAAIETAARHGYVAATIDYRSSSVKKDGRTHHHYPAQLVDVRSAVRWLRAHAARYGIDPSRFGAIGWSSGGHLALMLALLDPQTTLPDEYDNLDFPSSVQAAVSIAGVTELARDYQEATYPDMQQTIIELMGGTPEELPDAYYAASPLNHVTKDAPPILLIQGDEDRQVPLDQAFMLRDRLEAAGAFSKLLTLAFTGHVNDYTNPAIFPFFDSILKLIWPVATGLELVSSNGAASRA